MNPSPPTMIDDDQAPADAPTPEMENTSEQEEKRVPVSEAIRYRRRAQAAEQQLETLQQQLAQASDELSEAREQMDQVERRRQIDEQLIQADTIDLEAARLLTEAAVNQLDQAELAEVIADLKRHKPYLFRQRASAGGMSPHLRGGSEDVDHAAAAAAASGDRCDLLRYLRLRRRTN